MGDLRAAVNDLGRGKMAAETERDELQARVAALDALAAAVVRRELSAPPGVRSLDLGFRVWCQWFMFKGYG